MRCMTKITEAKLPEGVVWSFLLVGKEVEVEMNKFFIVLFCL